VNATVVVIGEHADYNDELMTLIDGLLELSYKDYLN